MNDTGCLGQMDKAVAAAIELYVTDGKKLEDGTSFVTELNNCMLTISLKDKSLSMEFDPNQEDFDGADYRLDMTIGIYQDIDSEDMERKLMGKEVARRG